MAKKTRRSGPTSAPRRPSNSGADTFRLHVLDMGTVMYGDCLVVEAAGKRILIDGGHLGDDSPKDGHPSIPEQLAHVLGGEPPFIFDLVVVTHCHADHIGCLPKLIDRRVIDAEMALVADPDLGWGRTGQDAMPPALTPQQERILAAVREEDVQRMPAADRDAFLADAAKLQDAYREMLETLAERGAKVIRYTKPADAKPVERAFASIGLTCLGPTREHLELCAAAISRIGRDSLDALGKLADETPTADSVPRILDDVTLDRTGIGAALNDQSIVLSLGIGNRKILLLGDMQLAVPEVPGLDDEMESLSEALEKAGPFDVIKTPHHTSYNGITSAVLNRHPTTKIWIHSGGSKDGGHPDAAALRALKALGADGRSTAFPRTDRNGLITIDLTGERIAISPSRGRLDDYSRNRDDFTPAAGALGGAGATPGTVAGGSGSPLAVPAPGSPASVGPPAPVLQPQADRVKVVTFLPPGLRAVIDISVDGGSVAAHGGAATDRTFRLAPATRERHIAFVTDTARLRTLVGAFADDCLRAVRADGHVVVDLGGRTDPAACVALVRGEPLVGVSGVVLLGGPEVVPPVVVDCLPPSLRSSVAQTTDDPDAFYVWSDEPYADRDADLVAELPVSRVLDGGDAGLLRRQLTSTPAGFSPRRHGHRNVNRPFAEHMFAHAGAGPQTPMMTTLAATPDTIGAAAVSGDLVYIMLHGSDSDGSRFWGETDTGAGMLALRTENVGEVPGATVFTGCCWGALAWYPIARDAGDGRSVKSRKPDGSLAMRFLERGARAFIGCTGAHYSPDQPPYETAGGPMHRAFWQHTAAGKPPAQAIFDAKKDYAQWMGTQRQTAESRAVSYKILRQYTCLGLGW
jgi:beta-lactamase superfamily II metal-dependent hydrolase